MVPAEALVIGDDVVAGDVHHLVEADRRRTVVVRIGERTGMVAPRLAVLHVGGDLDRKSLDRFHGQGGVGQQAVRIPPVFHLVQIGHGIHAGGGLRLEVVPRTVVVVRRGQRRGREGRVDHRRAAAAALRVHLVVVRTAEDDVRRSGDVFRDVVFEIRADRDAFVSALLDDAVLIEVAQAERSLEGRAAARDVHGVVGDHGRPEDFVLPVGVPHVGCDLLGREDRRLVVDAGLLVQIGHVFVAAQHVHLLVEGLDADAAVVAHPDFALLGALRRDDHHAVGSPRTVDGRRRGVFENLHRLDVRRVDHVDVARKSVDDPQGFVVALDRVGAADADLDGRSGLSVELVDLHARDTSLERLRHRDVGEFVDQVALDLGHGSREVAFALYAVADYDQFIHYETALRLL